MTTGLVLAVALVAAACSPDEEPQALDTPTPTTVETPGCGQLVQTSLEVLATRITAGDSTLNIQAIPATEADDAWFVAGEFAGDAFERAGDLALWAAVEDPTDRIVDTFYAVNDLAIEGSDWTELPSDVAADVSEDDPSVDILFDCVSG